MDFPTQNQNSATQPAPGQPPRKSVGWVFKTLFFLALAGTVLTTIAGAVVFWHFSRNLPQIITVADYRPPTVTRVLANGGREDALVGEFAGNERRYLVPYDKIPQIVVHAFTSAEDDRFFEHQGINLASILRASIANFKAGHVVQGGSTITQQVAKSLLLTPERNFVRKIKEVILAGRMEKNLSKQQILYLYLNQIYLGRGSYGVQAAAKTFFNKDISEISIAEAAVLAGMPQAPGKFSPHLNPKKAKERQLYVLRRMYENKYITQAQMTEAAAKPLRIYHDQDINKKHAPYLVEHIRRYLIDKYGEKAVYEGGMTVAIPTTIELTKAAKVSLHEGLRAVDKRLGYRGPIKHVKSSEIENVLREERLKLIERRLGYQMFMPDGRLDPVEALGEAGVRNDIELLEQGELYNAVVTSFNEKKKSAGVMIGAIKAELPLELMKWARPVKDDKNPQQVRGEPTSASKVLSKGDMILVRFQKTEGGEVVVSLEQEPTVQGAIFSVENSTGYVLAMEGGYSYAQSEFNRAIQAQRQPGSAFKPIIFAAALEKGYTPASIIIDSPIVYGSNEEGKWKPNNFEEKFYGDTTFRQALIKSRNVPTIKIVQAIQVPFLIEYARRLGMNAEFNADLSISLGSATVSLAELTRIYALFPRLGKKLNPIFILSVTDRDGNILEEHKPTGASLLSPVPIVALPKPAVSPSPQSTAPAYSDWNDPDQLMDPRVAYVMGHLMKEVVNYGTGHEAKSLGRTAAGKTGTTNDYLDAWFMGFTPQVTTGSWVGFDSQKPIGPGETGARAALPIWLNFMKEAVKPYPDTDFTIPPGVVFASIDPHSGKLATPNASTAIREAFIEGTEPTQATSTATTATDTASEFFKEDME